MTKSCIIKCLLSLLMIGYLVFALSFTSKMAGEDTCGREPQINIIDSVSRGFVSKEDIKVELGDLWTNLPRTCYDSINTYDIEQRILAKDNIERANCIILNDGSMRIDVVPLIPVARVFDSKNGNYYINRACKHMRANTRYRMDVPIIIGNFDDKLTPALAFPLLDFIAKNQDLTEFTNAIEVKSNGDLILVPTIKGHVINIGDTNDLKNKFDRLKIFYRKVMPAKGWDYYDTLSVKWRGQIVSKRRHARPQAVPILVEEHSDIDDMSTIQTTQTTGTSI